MHFKLLLCPTLCDPIDGSPPGSPVPGILQARTLEWVHVVLVVKNPPANAGDVRDMGSIPGLGRSPGGGKGNHSGILTWRIPMDRAAWGATVHGVAKRQTRLSDFIFLVFGTVRFVF